MFLPAVIRPAQMNRRRPSATPKHRDVAHPRARDTAHDGGASGNRRLQALPGGEGADDAAGVRAPTTVRRSRARTRETRPPRSAISARPAPPDRASRPARIPPSPPQEMEGRVELFIMSSRPQEQTSAERLPDASPGGTDRPRDALTPSPPLRRRMAGSCYDKCIDKKFGRDPNVGRTAAGRCTAKYWQSVARADAGAARRRRRRR